MMSIGGVIALSVIGGIVLLTLMIVAIVFIFKFLNKANKIMNNKLEKDKWEKAQREEKEEK
ncbi:hypothetical protein [Williamsoniiplasma lucivorax]|uniref:Uncharacterized protein n=1 Tax=Williamsoniiplasma lucivorax TaxID=209274 RepID=A0A2S5RCW2_9MOLU|nr:hypothetical protein [Williamsoniiplasma lucivorax]PPE05166.1 hypothetical protein ELUCI_v1c07020 [Williamsoniiplasma lucivorax]